jgi:hypothetical protein
MSTEYSVRLKDTMDTKYSSTHSIADNETKHRTEHSEQRSRKRDILDILADQANNGSPNRETENILPTLKQCGGEEQMD